MRRDYDALLRRSEVIAAQHRVQLIVPPQATALTVAVANALCDEGPVPGAVGLDEKTQARIFLFSLFFFSEFEYVRIRRYVRFSEGFIIVSSCVTVRTSTYGHDITIILPGKIVRRAKLLHGIVGVSGLRTSRPSKARARITDTPIVCRAELVYSPVLWMTWTGSFCVTSGSGRVRVRVRVCFRTSGLHHADLESFDEGDTSPIPFLFRVRALTAGGGGCAQTVRSARKYMIL